MGIFFSVIRGAGGWFKSGGFFGKCGGLFGTYHSPSLQARLRETQPGVLNWSASASKCNCRQGYHPTLPLVDVSVLRSGGDLCGDWWMHTNMSFAASIEVMPLCSFVMSDEQNRIMNDAVSCISLMLVFALSRLPSVSLREVMTLLLN